MVLNINREVRNSKDYLKVDFKLGTKEMYFDEWNEFYAAVCDERLEKPDISNTKTTQHLFGEIWTLEDYVNSISLQGNPEGRNTFWQNVEGNPSDNMFVHRGHVVDGKFDLAGPNN